MKCPVDGAVLSISDRSGVEIDFCPTCRGVWLDRGEIDKIIERDASSRQAPPAPQQSRDRGYSDYDDDDYRSNSSRHSGGQPPKKRRESFLGDLLDF
jgi:uncharacterized protein